MNNCRRYTWAASAWDKSPNRGDAQLLHTTYIRSRNAERAKAYARDVLRLFVRRQRFHITVRKATPAELGCVPTGSR